MQQPENTVNNSIYRKNLKRIIIETVLTSIGVGFSVSIITIFWNSIGMNQTQIGFVQMIFTIILCAFDIPMGYVADRFNRKILNIIGDFGVSIVFILYALSQNMYIVIVSECLLAIFTSMTNGVDQSFIKYNCNKIDETGELFKKLNIKINTAKSIGLFIVVIIGGFVAKYSLRLTIALSFIPYFIGGIIALKIKDYNNKIVVKHKNPIKDMIHSIKEILKEKNAKTYLFSFILSKEITHSQIWVFTPLLVLVGIPIEIISFGWVLNQAMRVFGSKLSEKAIHWKTSNKYIIPIIIEAVWMIIIIVNTNIITVWLFALNGFVHGLLEGNMTTALQQSTRDEVQTSVLSVASTGARLLYIPVVYIVNYLGNIKLQLSLVGVCLIFLPMCFINYLFLKKLDS